MSGSSPHSTIHETPWGFGVSCILQRVGTLRVVPCMRTMIWSEIDRVHRLRKWPWVTLPRRYLTFWSPRDAIAPYTVLVRVTSTTIMCFSRTQTQPQYLAQTGMVCSTASLAPFLFRPYYYISGTCCIMYTAPKIGML